MKRIFLINLIVFSLIFAGLLMLKPVMLGMAIPFVIYLLSGLITQPNKINLDFQRKLSTERTTPGLPIDVNVTVTNRGQRLNELMIEDMLPPGLAISKGTPRHLLQLNSGETATWKYTVKGNRGYYTFSLIQVESRDKLGITSTKHPFQTSNQLLVLPHMLKLRRVSIRPRRTRVYSGEIPARRGGTGVEFFGVRQYQTGDPPNFINWRASARDISKLYTNEYEQERVGDVGIILDGRERVNIVFGGTTIFEHSVLAAATLSNAFLQQGDRVSLLYYGKYLQWTFPGYGKFQRERILRALTTAEPGHSLVFSYLQFLPTQIFPPQSQIVLISPLTREDPDVLMQIRARGYRVLVISPDPIAFEKSFMPTNKDTWAANRILKIERELILRKLIRGGIRVVNWDVSQPFDHVVGWLSRVPVATRSFGKAT